MTCTLPATLSPESRILDAGGWFIPFARATHVVDLMPYETRRGRLNVQPQPGECFSKSTWLQANFLDPSLRLPFADGYFDYSVCGHTVEDLADPVPLLRELRRVSRAGYIETPSRLSEQTTAVRDRMSHEPGHPHHHWIVENEGGRLLLSAKPFAFRSVPPPVVPLNRFESLSARQPDAAVMRFHWEGDFSWALLPESEAMLRAHDLVRSLEIRPLDRVKDGVVRRLRRLKRRLHPSSARATSAWWDEMLKLSRPFSTIPL